MRQAKALCESGRCQLECLADCTDFRVEVEVTGSGHRAVCILAGGHTHIERIERDGEVIPQAGTNEVVEITPPTCGKIRRQPPPSPSPREQLPAYRAALKQLDMAEVLALAETIDDEDRAYLRRGIEMNLAISEWGFEVGGTASNCSRCIATDF